MKRLARKILIFNAIIAAATLGVAWYAGVRETYYLAWILAGAGGVLLLLAGGMAQNHAVPMHSGPGPVKNMAIQVNYLAAINERPDDREDRINLATLLFTVGALLVVEAACIGLVLPRFS